MTDVQAGISLLFSVYRPILVGGALMLAGTVSAILLFDGILGIFTVLVFLLVATRWFYLAGAASQKRKMAVDNLMTRIYHHEACLRDQQLPPPSTTSTFEEDLEALLALVGGLGGAPGHKQITTAWVREQLHFERRRMLV